MAELVRDFFSIQETRTEEERTSSIGAKLAHVISAAKNYTPGYRKLFADIIPADIGSIENLRDLPVLRKSELINCQNLFPPFGGFVDPNTSNSTHFFQSPGPIYEPGHRGID